MSFKSLVYFQIIILLFLSSCRVSRTPATSVSQNTLTNDYVSIYKDLAISEMRRTGVPASITLAQGIIESNYGRSTLATRANNHFGIKCHSTWTGARYYHDDDKRNECFRSYNNVAESFRDHSDFLVSGSRYDFLFELDQTDYEAWAKGLKKAGYATNPDYPNLLIGKIEQYGLYNYDNRSYKEENITNTNQINTAVVSVVDNPTSTPLVVAGNQNVSTSNSRIMVRNRINYIITREGDTYESLLEQFQLLGFELRRYNDLPEDYKVYPGQILYLQPKRNKADVGSDYHTVKEGETMYIISQEYGIKLKSLFELNLMEMGSEPVVGQKVWLRSVRPPG